MKKSPRIAIVLWLLPFFLTVPFGTSSAQENAEELNGSESYLQWAEKVRSDLKKGEGAAKKDNAEGDGQSNRARIEALQKSWDELIASSSDRDTAGYRDRWLHILDEYSWSMAEAERSDWTGWKNEDGVDYSLLSTLPDPEQWQDLHGELKKRGLDPDFPGTALSRRLIVLLGTFLGGDAGLFKKEWVEAYELAEKAVAGEDEYQTQRRKQSMDQLDETIIAILQWEERRFSQFEASLETLENLEGDEDMRSHGMHRLNVPELVGKVSDEKAAAWLKRIFALKLEADKLDFTSHAGTLDLAGEVLLQNPDTVVFPYWELVRGEKMTEIYALYEEEIERAFGKERGTRTNSDLRRAEGNMLIHRIKQDEIAAVVDRVIELQPAEDTWLPSGLENGLRGAENRKRLFDFYQQVLQKDPTLGAWGKFSNLAIELGRSDEVMAIAKESITDTEGEQSAPALKLLADLFLAGDQVEEGVAYLNQLASIRRKAAEELEVDPAADRFSDAADDAYDEVEDLGEKFLKLGDVLDDEELRKTGRELVSLKHSAILGMKNFSSYEYVRVAEHYLEQGDLKKAEEIVESRLEHTVEEVGKEDDFYPGGNAYASKLSDFQTALVEIYAKADRHEDVIRLIGEGPFWNYADFSRMIDSKEKLCFMLAESLAATGEKEQAVEILQALMRKGDFAGDDDAYALLSSLMEQEVLLAFLDELFAKDQFEERPLIWKASALLALDRAEDALDTIQKAIAIDPSDGEQGKGDRMRAYAVLSSIHKHLGNTEEVKFFDGVIEAIRMSEEADDVYNAGLHARGITQYEEALTHFADAYCIQSRMAVQLNEQGRFDEAEKRYQRAFELMPSSFGRVESHCFGCEGAFSGKRAQNAAERVFTRLAEETPDKPQVHYLLGYLREAQDRDEEALESYIRAVELDPDYLNAWKEIYSMTLSSRDNIDWRDKAIIARIRLDPYSRHGTVSIDKVFHLAPLRDAIPRPEDSDEKKETPLFGLKGTKAFLEELVIMQFEKAKELYPDSNITEEQIRKQLLNSGRSTQEESDRFRKALGDHDFLSGWWRLYPEILRSRG